MSSPREEVRALVDEAHKNLVDSGLIQSPAQAAHMVNSAMSRVGPHNSASRNDTADLVQAIALMLVIAEFAHVNGGKVSW